MPLASELPLVGNAPAETKSQDKITGEKDGTVQNGQTKWADKPGYSHEKKERISGRAKKIPVPPAPFPSCITCENDIQCGKMGVEKREGRVPKMKEDDPCMKVKEMERPGQSKSNNRFQPALNYALGGSNTHLADEGEGEEVGDGFVDGWMREMREGGASKRGEGVGEKRASKCYRKISGEGCAKTPKRGRAPRLRDTEDLLDRAESCPAFGESVGIKKTS
ncbi:hypothetical protein C8J57DRAFT_1230785 [Mycena rebaudengoi]|nr:hypothetical protein C8J57DRAFT_1230785 [Mycena rebaudengoi]